MLFVDLHGHSILKNSFIYGPSEKDFGNSICTYFFIIKCESYLLIFGINPNILNYLHASFWLKTPKFKQRECTSNWNKMCCLTLVKILWDCTDQQMVRLFRWPSKIGKSSELACLKLLRQLLIMTKGNLSYWKISKWKNKRIYAKRVHHLFNSLLDHWWISAFKWAQSWS